MFLATLLLAGVSVAQDVIGSFGCSMPICVLANSYMRFGTGSETSVNAWGLFQQPWYYSSTASTWYKLTFSSYPLDTAIGTGTSGPNWSGATVTDIYTLTNTGSTTDYSSFVVSSSDTTKSIGYGIIVSRRQFTVLGQSMWIQNTFSLGHNDSFVRVTTTVINNSSSTITNLIVWTGTRDDFVGTTDVNTKTRGNLVGGNFAAVTANNQTSYAIMITNPIDGVLFYSDTTGVMTAYALCCSFSNAYNTYPLTLAPSTPVATDGSYAAVLPIGNVSVGGSGTITWYYAAGTISSLTSVVNSVAVAQVAYAGGTTNTTSSTATATASATATATAIATNSPLPTAAPVQTITSTSSATQTSTATSTATVTTSTSSSTTATPTAAQTGSLQPSLSPLQTATGSPATSPNPVPTFTATRTESLSSSSSLSATSSRSPQASASISLSSSNTMSPFASTSPRTSRTPTQSISLTRVPTFTAYGTAYSSVSFNTTVSPQSSGQSTRSLTVSAPQSPTGSASASATSTPTPTPTPSSTSTYPLKVLIAQMPQMNFTSSTITTTSTTIVQVNTSDNLVYIPITFMILAAIGYFAWKKWKAWKAKQLKPALAEKKVQIRDPERT